MSSEVIEDGSRSRATAAPAEKLVVGVEGGGTKTDWVYLRSHAGGTTMLASGQLPAANIRQISDAALKSLLDQLPQEATHVGAFLAGFEERDRIRIVNLFANKWPQASISTGSDRDSSLAAAFKDRDGIVVISGTGSAITGRYDGRIEKAGGRGPLLGDRGSGYVISVEGVRSALESHDLNDRITYLAQLLMQELSLSRIDDLASWVQSADRTAIASLTPLMFAAASAGDEEIQAVIAAGAKALARYTESVVRRLEFPSPQIRLLGGVFLNRPFYAEIYRAALLELVPEANVEVCAESGAMGAAWLAAHVQLADSAASPAEPANEAPDVDLIVATTEQSNPRSVNIDSMSTAELIDCFVDEEAFVVNALRACRHEIECAVETVTQSMKAGGRLFYVGAGTSGRLGVLDASEIPPTFGEPPERVQGIIAGGDAALRTSVEGAEDDSIGGALAISGRNVTAADVVLGITASGRTPFVLGALSRARETGASTIMLTCNPARSRSHGTWDVEIDLPTGPELITGSTRLKAGTATKLVLNIVSTCSMIRLGSVRSNLMIDLKPTNTKLRDRAIRLVARLRNCSFEEARTILVRCGWNVRKAMNEDDRAE